MKKTGIKSDMRNCTVGRLLRVWTARRSIVVESLTLNLWKNDARHRNLCTASWCSLGKTLIHRSKGQGKGTTEMRCQMLCPLTQMDTQNLVDIQGSDGQRPECAGYEVQSQTAT